MQTESDYIVVGAGSAGAIVAARLAENDSASVLLLEAGPKDRSPLFHVPAAMRHAYNAPRYSWNYVTEPEPFLSGRSLVQPRGKVLGGSSSINGQLYLRGHPLDYDGWAEAGAAGWSYAEVLPYFQRLETRMDGDSGYQGREGRIGVSTMGGDHPLTRAFLAAGREAGYLETGDVNGAQQDGFGLLPKNVANGRRSSTARCYLRNPPASLDIQTGCHVRTIVIESRSARGIRFVRGGHELVARARREIILAAGAFNSPLILMQSGIGPAAQLRKHRIEVIHDLPGVGANLMDHPLTSLQVKCTKPVTLYRHLNPLSQARGVVEWALARKGMLASNHFDAACFIRTRAGIRSPNLQIALFQIAVAEGSNDFVREHAFQLQFACQRPRSRGHVRLASNDPLAAPRIRYNMLEHPEDVDEMAAGLRLSRELLAQPSLAAFTGEEIFPGVNVQDDAEIETWLRETCHSSYHPCGTCRMGVDPMAVVDPECRVQGMDRLRVADASIMPIIPSANLNCPTMMIGEKAADMIAGRQPLPSSNLPRFTDPHWQSRQR